MEAVRTLKANLKLEGKPCGWCQAHLALGDDAAVCTACEQLHHRGCWDAKAGCSTGGCTSAPLPRLDAAPAAGSPSPSPAGSPFPAGPSTSLPAALAPGMMACPRCTLAVSIGTQVCPGCRAITSPDGIYHGPKINAPGAAASLVLGLIGLVFCGVILGPFAIAKANSARQAMAADPTLGGEGLATAGKVLGIVDIVIFVLYVLIRMSNVH